MIEAWEIQRELPSEKIFRCLLVLSLAFGLSFSVGCGKKNIKLNARTSVDWAKNAVIYTVDLRSFSREGTFKALEVQIPTLKKLGVTIVSLMPIHPIGELNRKGKLGSPYAVKDFYAVNEEFGTWSDFQSLVKTVHQQGLKIIIDLVVHQAAWDNQILMEHPDWFMHNEEGALVSPDPDSFDVAQLDLGQHEPRKYMIAMMKYWVKEQHVDGFKCSLTESVPLDFWNVARKEVDDLKPVIMISESSQPEYHIQAFDMTYSWNICKLFSSLINDTTSVSLFEDSLKGESFRIPEGSILIRFDASLATDRERDQQDSKAMALLRFMIPGVPLIYNGEEVGNSRHGDIFNKAEIDWSKGSDIREFYEQLGSLRRNHPALSQGSYRSIPNTDNKRIYSFLRSSGLDSLVIVINFGKEKKDVGLKVPTGSSSVWKNQFSGERSQAKDSWITLTLLPRDFKVLVPATERTIR